MTINEETKKDLEKLEVAEIDVYVEGDMVFHPLLQHLGCGGFYSDPEELAQALRDHASEAPDKYLKFGFASTPESCQCLNVEDLIEAASQDMHEEWYERVTDACRAEIQIVQTVLDALHKRLMDFPTWRVDWSRKIKLPVIMGLPKKTGLGARKKIR